MFGNRWHFRILQERSEEGIAPTILPGRLRALVAGLRTWVHAHRNRRAEYSPQQNKSDHVRTISPTSRVGPARQSASEPDVSVLRGTAAMLAVTIQ